MLFTENFRIAIKALLANKMRSILTMLGIVIGVGAVVALMAIGEGASNSITSQIESLGSNLLTIFPGRDEGGPNQTATTNYLYYDDYEALARGLTNIAGIEPIFNTNATVTYEDNQVQVSTVATTESYEATNAYTMAYGRFLTNNDNNSQARVAVLGSTTAQDLFGGINPIGRTIKINGVNFEVIGVFKEKGGGGFTDPDSRVVIPIQTGYEKLLGAAALNSGRRIVTTITISAASQEAMDGVIVQAERILRREHSLGLTDELDFSVLNQTAFIEVFETVTNTLTIFLGAIAGISLLVGGIGIMNIMLVSVTERTREIGLRKAVGAKQRTILLQFLVETITMTLIGGVLGIGLGWSISLLVTATGALTAEMSPNSMLLAFLFSMAIGVFFGIYPAYRASRLRPIEALRYE